MACIKTKKKKPWHLRLMCYFISSDATVFLDILKIHNALLLCTFDYAANDRNNSEFHFLVNKILVPRILLDMNFILKCAIQKINITLL